MQYPDFFAQATGGQEPYPFQVRLAEEPLPALLHVPTGVGKTLAITLAWLWRRRFHPDEAVRKSTPRRLVYCLPMRNLVEQTQATIMDCLKRTDAGINLHVLMGGDFDDDWTLYPGADAILIGTQDMLLSRALNRGYGMSRFRWPAAFGLLHSDALWVFDEVQLFGAGLPTSAQLDGFRRKLGALGPVQSVWMSATLQPEWLETVDHPEPGSRRSLEPEDRHHPTLARRLAAPKRMHRLTGIAEKSYARDLAKAVERLHRPGTTTLVILNTVSRATELYRALAKHPSERILLHGRFRPSERKRAMDRLAQPGTERIIISTQVVEAGVDISSRTLITELAPWASIVQRLGRLNRRGEHDAAEAWWIDLEKQAPAPYDPRDLEQARTTLQQLEGLSVAPDELPPCDLSQPLVEVIRRRDLIDLFDTTPDLSGNDIDVGRFIRSGKEYDLQLFWRDLPDGAPQPDEPSPQRSELCPVPAGELRPMLKQGRLAWIWDHLEQQWRRLKADGVRPGLVVMLRGADGGYDAELGFTASAKEPVIPAPLTQKQRPEADGDDQQAFRVPELLSDHTDRVLAELDEIIRQMDGLHPHGDALRLAARWHDAGKTHPIFQETMRRALPNAAEGQVWAKSMGKPSRHRRRHFRHELASGLALLQKHPDRFLAAYLAAAHHGKVRLAIRSMPEEERPPEPGGRFARGIFDGDQLPEADLGGGERLPSTRLDLSVMDLGGAWLRSSLALRDDPALGPFRLALLEAVIRAADSRASARGGEEGAE